MQLAIKVQGRKKGSKERRTDLRNDTLNDKIWLEKEFFILKGMHVTE